MFTISLTNNSPDGKNVAVIFTLAAANKKGIITNAYNYALLFKLTDQ